MVIIHHYVRFLDKLNWEERFIVLLPPTHTLVSSYAGLPKLLGHLPTQQQ